MIRMKREKGRTLTWNAELLFLGREYPLGYAYFRDKVRGGFRGRRGVEDEGEIQKGIAMAEYVKKGKLV